MSVLGTGTADPTRVAPALAEAIGQVVLGKPEQVGLVVAAVLAGGHVLLEDTPGVGKTLLAKALARCVGAPSGRVQGTPDLLPGDITGVSVYEAGTGRWVFHPGPLFSHVLLVDEVNRATPRAQSALLEAMQEGHVTVDGTTHPLPDPFVVLATQNPDGDAGTFPLVAGQSDRFAVVVSLGLPGRAAERDLLLGRGGTAHLDDVAPVIDPATLRQVRRATAAVHAEPAVVDYVLDVVDALRAHPAVGAGPSPRAAQALLGVARGRAVVDGRDWVVPDDVKAVAPAVLAHRLAGPTRRGTEEARGLVDAVLGAVAAPVA